MELNKIKDIIEEYLNKKALKLFDISYQKADKTLTVLLDEKFDMNDIEQISNELSEYLDNYADEFEDNYILDVSTVGVERPIRSKDELNEAVGGYIYVETKENNYYGTLKSFEEDMLNLEVTNKTRKDVISIDYKEVNYVRYAVKF